MCQLARDEPNGHRAVCVAVQALAYASVALHPHVPGRYTYIWCWIWLASLHNIALEANDSLDGHDLGTVRAPIWSAGLTSSRVWSDIERRDQTHRKNTTMPLFKSSCAYSLRLITQSRSSDSLNWLFRNGYIDGPSIRVTSATVVLNQMVTGIHVAIPSSRNTNCRANTDLGGCEVFTGLVDADEAVKEKAARPPVRMRVHSELLLMV